MKMTLICLSFILVSRTVFSYALCVNDKGTRERCSIYTNEVSCNSQGNICFWLNYGEHGDNGGCSPTETGYGDFCAQFRKSYVCKNQNKCSWSGLESPLAPEDEGTPSQPKGFCAALEEKNQNLCRGRNEVTCSWSSECTWVWQ